MFSRASLEDALSIRGTPFCETRSAFCISPVVLPQHIVFFLRLQKTTICGIAAAKFFVLLYTSFLLFISKSMVLKDRRL